MRGPLADHPALNLGTDEIVTGVWSFGNKALVGLASKSATATGEYQTAPYRKVAAAAELAEPNTTMKLVDLDADTVTDVTAAQGTVIAGRGTRIGSYVYGFAYSGTTDDSTNGGYVHRRSLLRWDGTTTAPTAVTNAPDSGQAVRGHYNRLFVLGGRDVPGALTAHEFNTLFFSDPGGPVNLLAADWQNDVSGLSNKIVVDVDNPDDFGVGLAKIGDNLAIFKRRSVHVLSGYSDTTFQLRTFTTDVGCVDARTIVEQGDGCYFLSEQGYHYFDGVQMTLVSEPILSELATVTQQTVGISGDDGGRAEATTLPNNYILLQVGAQSFTTGAVTEGKAYLYHMPTGRWSRFSSLATANEVPTALGRTNYLPFIIDGDRLIKAQYLTVPEAVDTTERGFDSVASGGTTGRIPALWRSALIRVGTPLYMAQLHRLLIDYTFQLDPGADNDSDGWYVSAALGNGNTVVAEYQVPTQGSPTTYLYRRRDVADAFGEATDFQLTVEWKAGDDVPALAKAVLYDCTVEWQISRQRRST